MRAAADRPAPVVFVMGPTATGKTELAMHLVRRLPCDIVSVDSAMVYRGMDIGTAKPSAAELAQAPHRLIDICDPAQAYSAARFRDDATREIAAIHAAGRVPLLVGGTLLYFSALERGLSRMPAADADVRAKLSAQAGAQGWAALHARLAAADPDSARRIHHNDAQRIQRALEIIELSGRTPSDWRAESRRRSAPWPLLKLALMPGDRADSGARIAARFHAMLDAGLLAEVEKLHARPDLHAGLPAMRAVGYRQLWQHLAGELSLVEATERGIIATRQLAKRQQTWLRRERDVIALDCANELRFRQSEERIRAFIQAR